MKAAGIFARGGVALWLLVGLGCGGGGGGQPATTGEGGSTPLERPEQSATDGARQQQTGRPPAGEGPKPANGLVRTDADGRKWIDDIPLDVWFDDPLETYGSQAQVAAANTTSPLAGRTASPSEGSPTDPVVDPDPPDTAPGAAATDWTELIPAAVLDDEVKSLRNQLTSAMQTVATYNNNFQAIQWDGAALCALAGIATEHSEPLSWKDKAPWVRELGEKIERAAQERGRGAFEKTQAPYEQLISVLSGNLPAGVDPPEPHVPFAQTVSRNGVMRRMQTAADFLGKNMNTADRLRQEQSRAVHEASLLAALTKIISLDGFDAADEPDYAREAEALIDDARQARGAAEAGSFDAYRQAVDRMSTRCSNCHSKYRFE